MKFCICGDFAPKRSHSGFDFSDELTQSLLNGTNKDMFSELSDILSENDFNILNVETTLITEGTPIVKNGGVLCDHPLWARFLHENKFNVALTANNHIGDYGEDGVMKTLKVLENEGFYTVGSGKNKEDAEKALYLEKNGEKMAIVNSCEHEYGLAKDDYAGAMHTEPFRLIAKIKEAKRNADFVIVVLHGGVEHLAIPSPRLKTLMRGLAENGADMVVNNHPHCPMAYEIYNGVPIFYSMGNLVFHESTNNGMWNYGYVINAEYKKGMISFGIVPYFFGNGRVNRFYDDKKEYFMRYIDMLAKYSFDKKISEELFLTWCKMSGEWLDTILPISVNFKKNSYNCESHCEVLGTYFEEFVENKKEFDPEHQKHIDDIMHYKIINIK